LCVGESCRFFHFPPTSSLLSVGRNAQLPPCSVAGLLIILSGPAALRCCLSLLLMNSCQSLACLDTFSTAHYSPSCLILLVSRTAEQKLCLTALCEAREDHRQHSQSRYASRWPKLKLGSQRYPSGLFRVARELLVPPFHVSPTVTGVFLLLCIAQEVMLAVRTRASLRSGPAHSFLSSATVGRAFLGSARLSDSCLRFFVLVSSSPVASHGPDFMALFLLTVLVMIAPTPPTLL